MRSYALAAALAFASAARADVSPNVVPDAPPGSELAREAPEGLSTELHAYGRFAYTAVQTDPTVDFVGPTNGFRLPSARLELDGSYGPKLHFRFSLDAAREDQPDPNSLNGVRRVALADAFAEVGTERLYARVGQFKVPFNAEDLQSTATLKLAYRSVATRGVLLDEGYTEAGITLDRQLGVAVGGGLRAGDGRLSAEAAVFNGNGPDALVNSNDALAGAARVAFTTKTLTVGVSAFAQQLTTMDRLDLRLNQLRLGASADVLIEVGGLHVFAQALGQSTTETTVADQATPETTPPASLAGGAFVEVSYLLKSLGLEPAARVEVYRPDSLQQSHDLLYETLGVNWYLRDIPVKLVANVVLKQQKAERALKDNALILLAQAAF